MKIGKTNWRDRKTARVPILVISESSGFCTEALQRLRRHFSVLCLDADRKELIEAVRGANVLWGRLRHRIDTEILAVAPHLQVLVSPTTGLNHIDMKEVASRGIRVLSLRGETEFLRTIRATAEHTIALMLALVRHVPDAVSHVKAGGWDRDRFKGHELHGKRVGIVGHGRLGKIVTGYLKVFGCEVVASDPHPLEPPDVTLIPLENLLPSVDIVSIHVGLTGKTRLFFDRSCFERMKAGAYMVNTSRGELIDEDVLLESLISGGLGGAALDVLGNEKSTGMSDHPLVQYARAHSNLIITPHIGGATFESMEKTELFLAKRLIAKFCNNG